jgi:uncharacterized protein (TIGR03000 family)
VTTHARLAAAALSLLLGTGAARAGFFHRPYDMSLGPYEGGMGYSYNVAYSYLLPLNNGARYSPWSVPYPYDRPYRPYRPGRAVAAPADTVVLPEAPGPPPLVPVPAEGGPAVVEVVVPEAAEVWFDGAPTRQAGAVRVFHSPPLPPGGPYVYVVRARWEEGGRPAEQIKAVPVRPGERARVTFGALPVP